MLSDFLFIGSIAPVALLLWYIYKKDAHKEPPWQLCKSFLLGCAATVPICIVEIIVGFFVSTDSNEVGNGLGLFLSTLIGIGIIEELFKWLIVRFSNYNNINFNESFDALVYAVFASLGFAVVENLMYVFLSVLNGVLASFVTLIARFITAVPGHFFFGISMGYFFAKAKKAQVEQNRPHEVRYLILSILVPSFIHTIYDYLLLAGTNDGIVIWLTLLVVCYIVAIKLIKRSSKENVVLTQQ